MKYSGHPFPLSDRTKEKKFDSMKHIKTIFITLLVLLTCSMMLAGCGRKANALDYVDITFSGSNGNGRAELSMRTLELIESVIGGEPEPNESYSS